MIYLATALFSLTPTFAKEPSRKAYGDFRNYRRTQKAKWLQEESDRRERQRKQAEESRRQADIRRQEHERRLKEEQEKLKLEEAARRAAAEAAKMKAIQAAEQKRQQRRADEKAEIDQIHRTTGAYVGSKIKGKYERFSLEELTSSKPGNWLREYTKADFDQKVAELREHKASAVKTLFAKLCYINSTEKAILSRFLAELESTDPDSAHVIRYLMNRAGVN